jgi:inorganic pyrophosphatase
VIAINVHDKLAKDLHKLSDLEKKHPEKLDQVFKWFKYYKTTDGKAENTFGLNDQYQSEVIAKQVISEAHKHWQHLISTKK